ncbi:SDR family oxidoreductase [Brachybacterium squillarum]|uniref:SDR family oxidoreductase n=1 Tax=Brachybacterium squillarum TaxID=661979 RepID=UPI00026293A3|nr:SDR family oxidoreductase [Brachybacterium squillarum]
MARIAVLGGTGFLGRHAISRLLTDGHQVRAIVRSPRGADLPADVEIVPGDVTVPGTLPAALAGTEAVLLALNGGSTPARAVRVEEQGLAHVAAAAGAAGVGRMLLLTGMFSQPAFASHPWEQAKVRGASLLLDGPVPATVFRVGFVNETLARFVRGGRPVLIGRQPHPIRPIAADDIMAAASRAFDLPSTADRTYDVAGIQAITLREATAAYATAISGREVSPREVRVMPLSLMRAVNRLALKGEMTRPLGILSSMDRHGDVTDTSAWFRDIGAPPTSFPDWIARQRPGTTERTSS